MYNMAAVWSCARCPYFKSVLRTNPSVFSNSKIAASTRHWITSVDRRYSSSSSEEPNTPKEKRDEPIRFSTSKAKCQTLDDTLGAQKSDSSSPFYLGFGALAFIMYFAFIRNEDPSEADRWDLLKMRHSQEQETKTEVTPTEKEHPLS